MMNPKFGTNISLFTCSEVPQYITGFSPFKLIFGHNVRDPLFQVKEKLLENNDDPEQLEVTKYVISMRKKIKEFMKDANRNEIGGKTKQRVYYDKDSRKRNYKLGDKVLMFLPTFTNKLLANWKGPFEMVRRIDKFDYVYVYKERVCSNSFLKEVAMLFSPLTLLLRGVKMTGWTSMKS